jgi:hypothetical protein
MNDVTTTEKPETAEKKRVHRYYITSEDVLISRLSGVDADIVDLDDPGLRRKALIAEGILFLLAKGYTIAEILSGYAIPDRSLPAAKKPLGSPPPPVKRLKSLFSAVVAHRTRMLKDIIGENGQKLSHAEAKAAALAEVNSWGPEKVRAAEELFGHKDAA